LAMNIKTTRKKSGDIFRLNSTVIDKYRSMLLNNKDD